MSQSCVNCNFIRSPPACPMKEHMVANIRRGHNSLYADAYKSTLEILARAVVKLMKLRTAIWFSFCATE